MRKLLLAGFTVCLAAVAVVRAEAAESAPASIVGTWKGKDDAGVEGAFVFAADGSADMIRSGVSMKESVARNGGTMTYRYDPAAKPVELDFILESKDRPTRTLRCIVEFLSPDKMRLKMPDGDSRARDFSGPKEDILVVAKTSG